MKKQIFVPKKVNIKAPNPLPNEKAIGKIEDDKEFPISKSSEFEIVFGIKADLDGPKKPPHIDCILQIKYKIQSFSSESIQRYPSEKIDRSKSLMNIIFLLSNVSAHNPEIPETNEDGRVSHNINNEIPNEVEFGKYLLMISMQLK